MSTALALASQGMLETPEGLAHAKKLADMLAGSELLIPPHLRNRPADILLGLSMAQLMGLPPLPVLQAIFVVNGRPGWSAAFIIARANASGVFTGPIDWRDEGQGDSLAVTAYATLQDGREVSFTVPMSMARAEGWTRNSKYQTMPSLMLRYRSATLLVRLYAPHVLQGLQTVEELRDVAAAEQPEQAELVVEQPQVERTPPPSSRPQLEQRAVAEPEPQQQQAEQPVETSEGKRRREALDTLGRLRTEHPVWVREEAVRRGLTSPGKSSTEKIEEICKAVQARIDSAWKDPGEPQGEELMSVLVDTQLQLEEQDQGAEQVIKAAQAAGLPVGPDGPVVDGAPESMLRRFLHEMRGMVRL